MRTLKKIEPSWMKRFVILEVDLLGKGMKPQLTS